MIEWLIPSFLILGAAFIPKGKMKDERKIEKVFKNCNLSVKEGEEKKYPKFLRKTQENENYTTYFYTVPFGLKSKDFEEIKDELEEALNKEIDIVFDGVVIIKVYEEKLPESWSYDNELIRTGTWEIPIGKNHEGILYHDFEKYPHMLIGGVTRFGKTVFLKDVLFSLMMNQYDSAEFYILDLKGGLEFGHYLGFPPVKAVASDIYEAVEVLSYLSEELKGQQKLFREKGYKNIVDTPIRKRKFVIVDEGAELSPQIVSEKKYAQYCQSVLSEIARIGGGIGYRLLFCTQYPTREAIPMQVKMNIVARLSFIAAARIGSQVILDDTGAEELPSIPGRAIYQIEKQRIVQVPYIDDGYIFQNLDLKGFSTDSERSTGVEQCK